MIIGGVDLGGRKAAVSIFVDGVLTNVADFEVPKTTRDQELRTLALWAYGYLKVCDLVFIEEPLIGRGVRASLQVAQTSGAVLAGLAEIPWGSKGRECHLVPVGTWKKDVIGNGSANKEMVSLWLKSSHPSYAVQCADNQDRIDAICIGLYGVQLRDRAEHLEKL
jgi:Holliday junction resolvasome RuvABC endonuclease subunit